MSLITKESLQENTMVNELEKFEFHSPTTMGSSSSTDPIEKMILAKMGALHNVTMQLISLTVKLITEFDNCCPSSLAPLAKLINASTKLNEDLRLHKASQINQAMQLAQINIHPGAQAIVGSAIHYHTEVKENENTN